jgi:hypothetical protein
MQTQQPETDQTTPSAQSGDPLAEIDRLMQNRQDEERRAADEKIELDSERSHFATEFSGVCDHHVRPPMAAIIDRLRRNGGGGTIEERPEDVRLHHQHRLILWMSLSGEVTGTPRVDRLP